MKSIYEKRYGFTMLKDPKNLWEAIAIVSECGELLDDLAHGLRGSGRKPEAKKAFKMVLAAAKKWDRSERT